ncbi:MAG: geranylgeranylglycerol-phosphate geranylgeranyltransferase [Crocinitomicaceae bacterium]|nr:geranylgeranylglycerol-phosphate geranylgeranyltransferase [Crocinitomicaceae bacterium]
MKYYFKLIRPINLLIIGLTMVAVRYFFFSIGGKVIVDSTIEKFNFSLLVLSTILVAGAGNVINDYFDVKADKINKPNKLFITKYVSKRKAIMYHWFLNILSLIIASYLSLYYHTLLYFIIHLLAINILWGYSAYFKRKLLIGNILIASLTSLVIWQCGYFFYSIYEFNQTIYDIQDSTEFYKRLLSWKQTFLFDWNFIIFLCLFAFILNLAREIIKDLEDIPGDKKLNAQTLAIYLGIKKTSAVVSFILLMVPATYFLILINYTEKITLNDILITLPLLIASLILILISLIILFDQDINSKLKRIDQTIKLTMIIGVLTPLYWGVFFNSM